jgi:hypothetical protein
VNDNSPNFDKKEYTVTFKEDLSDLEVDANGHLIIAGNISASDLDKSDEFGIKSLM